MFIKSKEVDVMYPAKNALKTENCKQFLLYAAINLVCYLFTLFL